MRARKKVRRNLIEEEENGIDEEVQRGLHDDSGSDTELESENDDDAATSEEDDSNDDSNNSSKASEASDDSEKAVNPRRSAPPPLIQRNKGKSLQRTSRNEGNRAYSQSPRSTGRRPQRQGGVTYHQYFEEEEEDVAQSSRRSTRNQGRRRVRYDEDSEDEGLSVSSRGRVRKPNSRMRAFLGD